MIGTAIMVATGEIEDETDEKPASAAEMGRKGGKREPRKMTAERRAEIARKAAAKRWGENT